MKREAQDPVLLIRKFFASRDEFYLPKEGWASAQP